MLLTYYMSKQEILVLVSLIVLILLIVSILAIKGLHKHRLHNLYYHKYNKFLTKTERKLDINLKNKKISIREINHINNNDVLKNIENFSLINSNCNDLIASLNKNKQKQKKNLLFDLNALQELPKLIDVRLLEDLREPKLLKDLIVFLLKKRRKPTIDWIITCCFGTNNYFKHKKTLFFVYNGALVVINETTNKLIEPRVYFYADLTIETKTIVDDRILLMCDFIFKYQNQVILTKRIRRLKIMKNKLEEVNNLLMLLDSYQLYKDCASINDANKKHAHIKKMNEATLRKINTMNGRKFTSWVQLAFKSLYKTEIEIKSDDKIGTFLYMETEGKTVLVFIKRSLGKITPAYVNKFLIAKQKHKADEVWIITNSEFARPSLSLISEIKVKLINNNDLKYIINRYNTNYYKNF